MHAYAQTNIQLFNQLLAQGRPTAELCAVREAYELAMQLFGGQFQSNGKTVLAHLVGTASILASLDSPMQLVIAGLLHAAYSPAGFPKGHRGVTKAKQQLLLRTVGSAVEDCVSCYARMSWDARVIRARLEALEEITAIEREVLLIRLANELEDQLDLGLLYFTKHVANEIYRGPGSKLVVELARALGSPELAQGLERALRESAADERPEVLKRAELERSLVPPLSWKAD